MKRNWKIQRRNGPVKHVVHTSQAKREREIERETDDNPDKRGAPVNTNGRESRVANVHICKRRACCVLFTSATGHASTYGNPIARGTTRNARTIRSSSVHGPFDVVVCYFVCYFVCPGPPHRARNVFLVARVTPVTWPEHRCGAHADRKHR